MSVIKGFTGGLGGCLGVACAILLVVVGCVMMVGRSTHQVPTPVPVLETGQSPSPVSAPKTATTGREASHPTDLVVADAAVVYAAYEQNEVQADNDMKDKLLAVKGQVKKIGKDLLDTPYVTLDTEKSLFSVQCMFKKTDGDILADLRPGQAVVIGGKCAGKMGNVLIRECWMYDEGPSQREKAKQQAEAQRKRDEEQRKVDERRKQEEAKQQAAIEEARWHTWTTVDGEHTTEAKFLKSAGETVHLEKRDGTVITVQKSKLSADDQKWIKNQGWKKVQ